MSQWTTGQRLKDGKYIVEELLGFGGFGVTYRTLPQSTQQNRDSYLYAQYLRMDTIYSRGDS